jgi:hypothetical protein
MIAWLRSKKHSFAPSGESKTPTCLPITLSQLHSFLIFFVLFYNLFLGGDDGGDETMINRARETETVSPTTLQKRQVEREKKKLRRQLQEQQLTIEEKAAIRTKNTARRAELRQLLTAEERAAIRAKDAARKALWRQQRHQASEST